MSRSSMTAHSPLLALSGIGLITGLLFSSAVPAAANDEIPEPSPQGEVTEELIEESITRYGAEDSITGYDLDGAVEHFGGESEEEDVIVLETDVLFSPNEWELPEVAPTRIEEVVEDVPQGASVNVHGHTDSLPVEESQYDFDNQELSENRAQAVADVLSDVRPDLELSVEGFGDSDPAVTEDDDDPDTFAANRRVEIRYGD